MEIEVIFKNPRRVWKIEVPAGLPEKEVERQLDNVKGLGGMTRRAIMRQLKKQGYVFASPPPSLKATRL